MSKVSEALAHTIKGGLIVWDPAPVCVYYNGSQMTSQRVKNKKVRHETKSRGVSVVLYTLWRLLWSITVDMHTEKCNLFVLYNKNSNGLLKDFWGMRKEKQASWCGLTWIWRHLCVCPLIDHGQQPTKIYTEARLLYNSVEHVLFYCLS